MAGEKREQGLVNNAVLENTTNYDMSTDQGYEGDDESDIEPRKKKPRTIGTHAPQSSDASDHTDTVNKTDENDISNASKPKAGFLDLPAEIRKRIYDIWWDESPMDFPKKRWKRCHRCPEIKNPNLEGRFDRLKEQPCDCSPKYAYLSDVRLVCKQLRRETTPYFLPLLRNFVFRVNFQGNFEEDEAPLDHGRMQSDGYDGGKWTLKECRTEQQCSERGDFAVVWDPEEPWTSRSVENPVADRLLTALGPTALVHVGGLEYNFILHYTRKRATLPSATEFHATCPCHDIFSHGRRYLEQGLREKLMVNIHCYPFLTRSYPTTQPRINKVLLFEKADPADYTKIVEKIWRQCTLSARRITKRSRIDYRSYKYDEDNSKSFGKVIVRFSKMDLDSTFDFEDAKVEHPANGVKMVNLFDTTEHMGFPDDDAIEDGDEIDEESEPVSLPDTIESEEEEEEEEPRPKPDYLYSRSEIMRRLYGDYTSSNSDD